MQTWKEGEKSTLTLGTCPGRYDRVEALADCRVLVSSWTASAVNVVKGNTFSNVATGIAGPGDVSIDMKRNVLAVPQFDGAKSSCLKIR